jgi:hypothetical protein
MKVTRVGSIDAGSTSSSGNAAGPAGGDLGGGYPSPTVTGLDGKPFSAPGTETNGVVPTYNSSTGKWDWDVPSSGGLSSVTDSITTVSPATSMTVPAHSLTNLGGGDAELGYLTNTYGAQDILNTVAASGASQTLPATANVHDVTLTAGCTFTLPTLVSGYGDAITLILRQDATGSRTVTWPGSVSWVTGTAPTLKTAANAVDVITLFTVDGGTTWGGAYVSSGFTSPLTTKGDLYGRSASADARVPVGADGQVLTADSTNADGVSWQTPVSVGPQHVHVNNHLYNGDGSTTVFILPAGAVDAYSIAVYIGGTRTQDWTLTATGGVFDTLTFGSAPTSGTNNIAVDVVAAL